MLRNLELIILKMLLCESSCFLNKAQIYENV